MPWQVSPLAGQPELLDFVEQTASGPLAGTTREPSLRELSMKQVVRTRGAKIYPENAGQNFRAAAQLARISEPNANPAPKQLPDAE